MKHIDIGQWVDLVRGLPIDNQDRAEAHLSECGRCSRSVSLLRDFVAICSAEGAKEPPRYAVSSAKAIYALQRPEKVYFPKLLGRLVYDSFREPLPEGLRARHRLSRYAVYEAGGYSLDLRLERQMGLANVSLVGQLASHGASAQPPVDLPVFLVSGKDIVAWTVTNAFGEFEIEYEPKEHLRLYVQPDLNLRKHIQVPLSRLSGMTPGDTPDKKPAIRRKTTRKMDS